MLALYSATHSLHTFCARSSAQWYGSAVMSFCIRFLSMSTEYATVNKGWWNYVPKFCKLCAPLLRIMRIANYVRHFLECVLYIFLT